MKFVLYVNNKIKVIKRMAYGFRNEEYFFLRIRAMFPGNIGGTKKSSLKQAEDMDRDRRTNEIPSDREHELDLDEELRNSQLCPAAFTLRGAA